MPADSRHGLAATLVASLALLTAHPCALGCSLGAERDLEFQPADSRLGVKDSGAIAHWFVFGATKLVEELEDHLPPHTLVLDLKNVIYVDSTGAEALENLVRTCRKQGVRLVVSGLINQPHDIARRTGLLELITAQSPDDLQPDVAHAIDAAVAGLPPRPDDAAEMGYSGA